MFSNLCVFFAGAARNYTTQMMDGSLSTEIFVPKLEKNTFAYTLRIRSIASHAYFDVYTYITGTLRDPQTHISLNEVPDKIIHPNHGDNETVVMQLSVDEGFESSEARSFFSAYYSNTLGGMNNEESLRISTSDKKTSHCGNMLIIPHRKISNNNVDLMLKGTIEDFNPDADAGAYCFAYISLHANMLLHISTCTMIVTPEQTHQWTPNVTMSSQGCNPCRSGESFTILCQIDGFRNANIRMFLVRANQAVEPLDIEDHESIPYMQLVSYSVWRASTRNSGTYLCTADSVDEDTAAHAEGQITMTFVE